LGKHLQVDSACLLKTASDMGELQIRAVWVVKMVFLCSEKHLDLDQPYLGDFFEASDSLP
jgi:hypothetical protein